MFASSRSSTAGSGLSPNCAFCFSSSTRRLLSVVLYEVDDCICASIVVSARLRASSISLSIV